MSRSARSDHGGWRPGRLLRRALLWGLMLLGALQLWYLFWVIIFSFSNPVTTSFMRHEALRLGQLAPPRKVDYQWRDDAEISRYAKQAAVASEDANFMTHYGLDFEAIKIAHQRNSRSGSEQLRGGSTITQQLAKNLFLSSNQNYLRKAQEAVISLMLETVMSKKRILELYLNVVEFGDGIFGIESAAQHYYHKSASKLSRKEAATLIALLPNPKSYGPAIKSTFIARRAARIQKYMPGAVLPP